MPKIRVLLVDDHAVLRAGIRVLLDMQPDLEVVGEAGDGQQAIVCTRELQPDVVLLDVAMPGLDGLAAARQIKAEWPQTRVLILTQHENKEYVMPALRIGASGYVLKRAAGDELINAIRVVHNDGVFLDPTIANIVAGGIRREPDAPVDPLDNLSDREREVLVLLAQGRTYQQIGETLYISPKTVDFHRANVLRKLDLSSRADLTKFAALRGLIN